MIKLIELLKLLIFEIGLATANICDANEHIQYLVSGPNGVPDNQLNASSFVKSTYSPSRARLYAKSRNWCANKKDSQPYIQVQFDDIWNVVGIVTQGRHEGVNDKWVTYYKVRYSQNGSEWTEYNEIFKGNEDRDTPVVNLINEAKRMKYLRIYPVQWTIASKPAYNVPCLRFDVLGCKEVDRCAESLFSAADGDLIDSLNSSSGYAVGISAGYASVKIGEAEEDTYIEVIFSVPVNITGLLIEGRPDENNWIESLTISYSIDSDEWTEQEGFLGNADNETQIYHGLENAVSVRFLRIYPSCHGYPNLTFGVLGCKDTLTSQTSPYPSASTDTNEGTSTIQSLQTTDAVTYITLTDSALPTTVSTSKTSESLTSEVETNDPTTLPISETSSTTNENQTELSQIISSDGATTVAMESTGKSTADYYCKMVCPEYYTIYKLNEIVRKLKEELKTERKFTSNYIRSKTSAADNRVTTTAIGYTAVLILIAFGGSIVLMDLPRIVKLTKKIKRALSKA